MSWVSDLLLQPSQSSQAPHCSAACRVYRVPTYRFLMPPEVHCGLPDVCLGRWVEQQTWIKLLSMQAGKPRNDSAQRCWPAKHPSAGAGRTDWVSKGCKGNFNRQLAWSHLHSTIQAQLQLWDHGAESPPVRTLLASSAARQGNLA